MPLNSDGSKASQFLEPLSEEQKPVPQSKKKTSSNTIDEVDRMNHKELKEEEHEQAHQQKELENLGKKEQKNSAAPETSGKKVT